MKDTHTTPEAGASADAARPDTTSEPPTPAYELVRRKRGRPSNKAAPDGQINLITGEQVRYLPTEWEESEKKDPTEDNAHDAEVAAGRSSLERDLAPSREEWIETQRLQRRHRFSKHLTAWGAGWAVRNEKPSVKLALVAHLTAMEGLGWHNLPLASVGEPWGQSRGTMSSGSKTLVELGLLERIEHPGRREKWRVTSLLIELTEQAEETQRVPSARTVDPEPASTEEQEGARSARGGARSPRGQRALSAHVDIEESELLARAGDEKETTSSERFRAPGASCVECGGEVTTDWHTGQPNPRCRSCFAKYRSAQSSPRTQGEPPPPPPVYEPAPCPDALSRSEQTAAARNLRRAILRAPESAGSGLQDDTEGDRSSGEAEAVTGPPGASVVVGGSTHAI